MPTYVVKDDEIAINGVKYHVSGGVTLSLASSWPIKTVTGDYNEDTLPLRSVHSWHDQTGGIGVDRWKGPEDDNRAWFSESEIRFRNHLLLSPLRTTTVAVSPTTSSPPTVIGQFNGLPYAAFGQDVRRYTVGSDSWSSSLVTLAGAVPYSSITVTLNGTTYIIFTHTAGYAYSSNGSSWTESTKSGDYMAFWDNRLWGIGPTGQMWYAFVPGTETNEAFLPLRTGETVTSCFVGPNSDGEWILYVMTTKNLYAHDADNAVFIRLDDIPVAVSSIPGALACSWRGDIYISADSSVLRYVPGRPATIGIISPDRDDGIASGYYGNIASMIPTAYALLVGIAPAAGASGPILAFNGKAWSAVTLAGTNLTASNLTPVLTSSVTRLYFSYLTNDKMAYCVLGPPRLTKQDTSYTYASSAIHKYPWFDAGQNEITKTLLEVRVTCQDVTANETVLVQIAYDYAEGSSDASYTTLGTIAAAGNNTTTVYTIDSSGGVGNGTPSGKDFVAVRIKLTLSRGSTNTLSPDVSRVALVYRKKLPAKYQVACKLDLTKDYAGKSPAALRAALITAAESTTLVEVTYRNDTGGTRNYYMDIAQLQGIEKTGLAEDGMVDIVAIEV